MKSLTSLKILGFITALLASAQLQAQTAVIPSVEGVGNRVQTYSAASQNFTLAATPTSVCTLTGSATKTIYVKSVSVSGLKTTGGVSSLGIYKNTAANSGGTAVAGNAVRADPSNAAATATYQHYTANPTVGGGMLIYSNYMSFMAPGGTTDIVPHTVSFGSALDQHNVLRGTSSQLSVHLAGATLTGGVFNCNFVWMEK